MKHDIFRWKMPSNELIVVFIIIALSLAIGIINPAFFTLGSIFDTSRAMTIILVFALCEMVTIISGGIDVSFPAVASFSLYLTIQVMNNYHINNVFFAFAFSGILGLAWGALNGLLIGKYKIPALIATLGTSSLANGAILVISQGREISNIPSSIDVLSHKYLFTVLNTTGTKSSLTVFVILPILLCFLIYWILRYTMIGRKIYAVGGDINAARITGINVKRTQYFVYSATGLLIGIAAISQTILVRNANPSNLMGSEMMVIAAVVLGGTRISGGHGSVIGTVLGVLLITLVSNNLIMIGIPNSWQTFALGLIIVIGTSITSIRAKRIELSPKV